MTLNAQEAMPDGGELSLALKKEEVKNTQFADLNPGLYAVVKVNDTGVGIPEEYKNKIFEPFFTTKQDRQGAGLGLSSVYGAARAHDGTVKLEDSSNGTEFIMYLPIAASRMDHTLKKEGTDIHPQSGCILIVDDEEILRVIMRRLIEDLGYSVLEASTVREAVDCYSKEKEKIDGVLLDLFLPDQEGFEAIDALKKINPDVRIMVMTGFGMEKNMKKMREEGINHFITKPIGKQEMAYHLYRFMSEK